MVAHRLGERPPQARPTPAGRPVFPDRPPLRCALMSAPAVRRVAAGLGGSPAAGCCAWCSTPIRRPRTAPAAAGLPAPSWLLGYGSVAVLLITAVVLRSSWPTARLERFHPPADAPAAAADAARSVGWSGSCCSRSVLVTAAGRRGVQRGQPGAVARPASCSGSGCRCCASCSATSSAGSTRSSPWCGSSIAAGDTDDATRAAPGCRPPSCSASSGTCRRTTARARPGRWRPSSRAYCVGALGLGLRWGHRWLATGEGFGALSAIGGSPVRLARARAAARAAWRP